MCSAATKVESKYSIITILILVSFCFQIVEIHFLFLTFILSLHIMTIRGRVLFNILNLVTSGIDNLNNIHRTRYTANLKCMITKRSQTPYRHKL